MIITCGECQAKFQVAPEQIKVTGSKVRCSHCGYVFTVYRPGGAEPGPGTAGRPARPAQETGTDDQASRYNKGSGTIGNNLNLLQSDDLESPQARREIRRLLYADNEEDEDFDDETWAEAGLDEATGRPPLRRRPAPSGAAPEQPEQSRTERPSAEQSEFPPDEGSWAEDSDDSESPEQDDPGDGLGLAADPTRPSQPRRASPRRVGDDLPPILTPAFGGEVRSPVIRVKNRRNGLFLGLAIFCAALTIGLYYISGRPEPLALNEGDGPPPQVQAAAPAPALDGGSDPRGIERITFTPNDNIKHFYRPNEKEGELLVITGRVRNSYPAPRSFIRLRGLLLDQHGKTLADRFVYAGNLISEEDLAALPKEEIMARLNIKGGLDGQNTNIAPGQEVPFMVVFDKVPPDKDEYQIIPVGSSPTD
jgi:predicted Zn finger-like uncharacterized protein